MSLEKVTSEDQQISNLEESLKNLSPANESKADNKSKDEIFELIKENKIADTIEYINSNKLKEIDCVDEHGTTPLQYAAFRGYYDLCQLLIKKGADVNAKTHDQGYSALMFAAISNHKQVVGLLLENGADSDYTNKIGRTASQMAAFVNSYESVDLIKNFIPLKDLEYFTQIRSINEKEPKLPKGDCVKELHKLLIDSNNYSPVRILKAIKFSKNNVILENIDKIIRTLDAFTTKAFKSEENECPNDILSFKLHLYKYILEYLQIQKKNLLAKQQQQQQAVGKEKESINENDDEFVAKLFELSIKKFLTEEEVTIKVDENNEKKQYRVFEEKFLRELIRQFPYKECAIVRQMVTILARIQIGSHPGALNVITSCLNGQRFYMDDSGDDDGQTSQSSKKHNLECATCLNKNENVKLCTHCRKVAYCDQFCQRLHWPLHKKEKLDTK